MKFSLLLLCAVDIASAWQSEGSCAPAHVCSLEGTLVTMWKGVDRSFETDLNQRSKDYSSFSSSPTVTENKWWKIHNWVRPYNILRRPTFYTPLLLETHNVKCLEVRCFLDLSFPCCCEGHHTGPCVCPSRSIGDTHSFHGRCTAVCLCCLSVWQNTRPLVPGWYPCPTRSHIHIAGLCDLDHNCKINKDSVTIYTFFKG